MSTSTVTSSSSTLGCRLVCLQNTHEDIPLPDGVTVTIGRTPTSKIVDARCSRNQVALTSKWSERKVKIQQLGNNPSSVDGTVIGVKNELEVGEEATIFVLSGQYPHKVVFSRDKRKESDKKTKDKTSQVTNNGATRNNHHRSSLDIKPEKEDVKKNTKKRSASTDSGAPDVKRKKHKDEQGESEKSDTSSLEDVYKNRTVGNDKEHLDLMTSKLEAMKQNIDKGKTAESSSKHRSKQENKTSSSALDTTQKKPSSPSLSSSSVAKENTWTQHEHLYVFTSKGVENRDKVAGFDMDGTIILTKSGKTFPTDAHDWKIAFPDIFGKLKKLHKDGFKLVIFTNQLGVARGKIKIEELKTKLENIIAKLQVPVQAFVATHQGKYRKPVDGMWRKLKGQYNGGISIDSSSCVYVGDAAGRPADWEPKKKKDFSLSDRLFALNIGVEFHTPEEFFLGRKKAPFTMPKFDPRKVSSSTPLLPSGCKLTSEDKEIIVMVGLPASGKSHVTKHSLKPKGYAVVNRDTLGSWQKCVKVTKESVVNSSVVVDNTNLTPEERKRYIDCAKEAGVPCRCFLMTTTFEHCRHNEKFREMTDSSHAKINEMIFNSAKSKFKEPNMSEGFSEIVKVNFVPKFSSSSTAAEYKRFINEK